MFHHKLIIFEFTQILFSWVLVRFSLFVLDYYGEVHEDTNFGTICASLLLTAFNILAVFGSPYLIWKWFKEIDEPTMTLSRYWILTLGFSATFAFIVTSFIRPITLYNVDVYQSKTVVIKYITGATSTHTEENRGRGIYFVVTFIPIMVTHFYIYMKKVLSPVQENMIPKKDFSEWAVYHWVMYFGEIFAFVGIITMGINMDQYDYDESAGWIFLMVFLCAFLPCSWFLPCNLKPTSSRV